MTLQNRVKIHEVVTLAQDWAILRKTRLSFLRQDGQWQEQWRETYDRGNGATILLYDPARRTVLLTCQFRYPAMVNGYDDLMIETPAGLLEHATPGERIRAEVEEETGFRVGAITPLFDLFMSPGSVTERLYFFAAPYDPQDRVGPGGGCADEGEDIGLLEMPLESALAAIGDGRIRDAKTVILLQHAALHIFGPMPVAKTAA
ncbi:NUDIX domain-containing protein [Acidisoma sp. 7E03]